MDDGSESTSAELLRHAAIFRAAARGMRDKARAARLVKLADELTERAQRAGARL